VTWAAVLALAAASYSVGPADDVLRREPASYRQRAELDLLRAAWREILQNVERESKIDYRNSKGEVWSSSVDDILMHVAMHGAYHRGQIATVVRTGSGETPAYTDYIHAVRSSAI
jgi:uncharacterized damage-inducible protein DinB